MKVIYMNINNFVSYLVSTVFISVTLWLGYSVNYMSQEMAKMGVRVQIQTETSITMYEAQKELSKIIVDLHEKDMKQHYNIIDIQKRLDRLESE